MHTRINSEELIAHLTSAKALRPKNDALLFDEIVRRTGAPDTMWANSVRMALKKKNNPLREAHRVEMRLRTEASVEISPR